MIYIAPQLLQIVDNELLDRFFKVFHNSIKKLINEDP